ncbi:MAG: hypothetical protein N3A66_01235, partial [Planctomycetota bacterium]|nr:hypothetical protein [Planctomycetota bacterium]
MRGKKPTMLFLAVAAFWGSLLSAAEPNQIVLRSSAKAPIADGVLAPGEYDEAVQLHHAIIRADGVLLKEKRFHTTVFLTWHGQNLHIAYLNPLLPGEYPLTETFRLTAEDSGTEQAPVVYRSEGKGAARLNGGRRLQ